MFDTFKRREANRRESRHSYLSLCRAKGLAPEAELLDMLSWWRFHGLPKRPRPAGRSDQRTAGQRTPLGHTQVATQ
jgi:hypothetical protein